MDELKNKIVEVAQVLMSISVPIALDDQIAQPIKACAERLIALSKTEENSTEVHEHVPMEAHEEEE